MALVEKIFCDFCGNEISGQDRVKLADGDICKKCAAAASPFLKGVKKLTVADMREHLACREANKKKLRSFIPDLVLGSSVNVYIDNAAGNFVVSGSKEYAAENADVIPLSEVRSVILETEEIKVNPGSGDEKCGFSYQFRMKIKLADRWFDEIAFKLSEIQPESRSEEIYRRYRHQAYEISSALTGAASYTSKHWSSLNGVPVGVSGIVGGDTVAGTVFQSGAPWVCGCGSINTAGVCSNCGETRANARRKAEDNISG